MRELKDGQHDRTLAELYRVSGEELSRQVERYVKAVESYVSLYGEEEVSVYSAPGRSEIGGNHTDHQHGAVLAAAIDLDTIAVVGKQQANTIEITSEGYRPISVDLGEIDKTGPEGTTLALVKGVAKGFQDRGFRIESFKAYVTSNVLNGAGLSSSAAFEALIGAVFSGMYNEGEISAVDIAMIGQYAENVYFGKPCGLMDQMACSVGSLVAIDFRDPSKAEMEKITFDIEESGYALCIIDTKGSHADLTDDYAAIPAEMKAVARALGKEVLREVPADEFYANIGSVRETCGDRAVLRAIHFFEENQRAIDEAAALKAGSMETFLKLYAQSAKSSFEYLQNIYSVKNLQNQAVAVALAVSEHILGGNGLSRVHGGGFAGTIQTFVKKEFAEEYKARMEAILGRDTCHMLRIRPCGGIQVI